jgi:hypothetical protein
MSRSAHSLIPNAFSDSDDELLVKIAEIFSAGIARMREFFDPCLSPW